MADKKKDIIVIGSHEFDKIKVGKVFNVITTIIFGVWAMVIFVMLPVLSIPVFLIVSGILMALFIASCLISNYCLKDYKPDKIPDKKNM